MKPPVPTESKVISLFLAAAWLAVASCAAAADEPSPNPTSLSFAAGGTIRMQLNMGTVEVVGVPEDKITVSWRAKSSRSERRVSAKLQRSGAKEATLDLDGPDDDIRYRIEVPRQANVSIQMNAGELNVSGIVGNMDAELLPGGMD